MTQKYQVKRRKQKMPRLLKNTEDDLFVLAQKMKKLREEIEAKKLNNELFQKFSVETDKEVNSK